mgnify:CR=1 FL=1
MTAQHTPGPWTVEPEPDGWSVTTNVYFLATVYFGHEGPKDTEASANARLIAAAPDLLAALQNVVRCIEAEGCNHVAIEGAHAVIAKAEASA